MTIKFVTPLGGFIKEQVDFGPNTIAPVPNVNDVIDLGADRQMKVSERWFRYVAAEVVGSEVPHTIVTLVLVPLS